MKKRRYKVRPWRAEEDLPVHELLLVNGAPIRIEIPANRADDLIIIERLADGMTARAPRCWLVAVGLVVDDDQWARAAWRVISSRCTANERWRRVMRLRGE